LHQLEDMLEKVELQVGQVLFREGDVGDSLYIILNGFVEIIKIFGSPDARLVAVSREI